MGAIEAKLQALGIELPTKVERGKGLIPAVQHGDLLFVSGHGPSANDGTLLYRGRVGAEVSPEEAYIWVDGKPVTHRSSSVDLPPGDHKIVVYNYGYKPQVHDVHVVAGQRQEVNAFLQPVNEKVSSPWGRIQIERAPANALVFLNGTTPEFFVGHVDEMNNHIIGDQQLIVPVGTHQVHILANKTGAGDLVGEPG